MIQTIRTSPPVLDSSLVPHQTQMLWSSLSLSFCLSIGPHSPSVCWEGGRGEGWSEGNADFQMHLIRESLRPPPKYKHLALDRKLVNGQTGRNWDKTRIILINAPVSLQFCFNLGGEKKVDKQETSDHVKTPQNRLKGPDYPVRCGVNISQQGMAKILADTE